MPVSSTDLILVAVLNNKRDLEIARVLGWYRIPLQHFPKTVAVEWLAFYQTSKFGKEKWAINYIVPVRGHELTTRAELFRDQPDHSWANESYYKVQLGPLKRLPRPIPSRKWRRITFLYTTGGRLLASEEINDLIIQSEERELLWKALRERGLQAERRYETQKGTQPKVKDCAVWTKLERNSATTPASANPVVLPMLRHCRIRYVPPGSHTAARMNRAIVFGMVFIIVLFEPLRERSPHEPTI